MPRDKSAAPSTPRKRAPRKPPTTGKVKTRAKATVSRFVGPEQRAELIAEAAFFRAEKRGFAPGHEVQDWLAAEAEVDTRLMSALA